MFAQFRNCVDVHWGHLRACLAARANAGIGGDVRCKVSVLRQTHAGSLRRNHTYVNICCVAWLNWRVPGLKAQSVPCPKMDHLDILTKHVQRWGEASLILGCSQRVWPIQNKVSETLIWSSSFGGLGLGYPFFFFFFSVVYFSRGT